MQPHDHDTHWCEVGGQPPGPGSNLAGPSPERKRMDRRMKRIAITVFLAFLVAFFAVEASRLAGSRSLAASTAVHAAAPVVVETIPVQPAATNPSLSLPGETHAWYESMIYARVTGYVKKWNVDIGDHVSKGQVLTEIDTPELDAQLVAAQAKLNAAGADVEVRRTEAEFARTTYARWRDAPKGVVSEQERADKKAEFDAGMARLASARAQVSLDQADVDRFEAFEKFKLVTAPYDGTIVERRIDIGNLVTAGSSSGTMPLYRMAQDDPMRVWVDVPQAAAADLMKKGVPVGIVTNEASNQRLEGTIVRTAGAIDTQARTFRVEIDVPNPKGALVSGMYVQAVFSLPAEGMLQVPASALLFRSTGPQVAAVGADNRIHLHSVTIARDDGAIVLISSGVAQGDRVALNLSSEVTEGQQVVAKENGPSPQAAAAPKG